MATYQVQTNFTAGELSPLLDLRFDFNKYANGVKALENYIVLPQGGVRRRPGTRFVKEVKDSSRAVCLIPFEFSTEQAYILEFGHHYIRFYMNAGQILFESGLPVELETDYEEADLFDIKFAQSADVLYLVHPKYPPQRLSRFSHTHWALSEVRFIDGPYMKPNTAADKTVTSSLGGEQPNNVITAISNNGSGLIRVSATGHGFSTGQHVHIEGVVGAPEANGAWTVTTVDANNFDLNSSTFVTVSSIGGLATRLTNLTASGHQPFSPAHVGSLWRIPDTAGGWGYVKVEAYESSTSVWAYIHSAVATDARSNWREGSWSGLRGYPGAVSFFEQRLMFGGSLYQPQTIWGSVPEDYEDMTPGTEDDDAVSYTLASNQVNIIQWLSSSDDLLIGTVGGEFVMFGGNDSPLTPTNVTVRRKSTNGSMNASPVAISNAALFIQRAGRKIREFALNENRQYQAPDITLFAEHITDPSLVQMDYQQEPDSIIWLVRSDGVLLSITYLPSQEVIAFSRHMTLGAFESVAVIPHPSGTSDQVWVVVRRDINGATKRYIEYLDPDLYVDSGIAYQGPPALALSGADHLNGEMVTLNCNCAAAFPEVEVIGGQVLLPLPAESVMIGLPYIPRIVTNKPEVKLQNGTSQGRLKRWVTLNVRVLDTLGLTINGDTYAFRDTEVPMDEPPALFTGDISVSNGGWDRDGEVEIRQDQPLSSTILGFFGLLDVDQASE